MGRGRVVVRVLLDLHLGLGREVHRSPDATRGTPPTVRGGQRHDKPATSGADSCTDVYLVS